MISFTKMKSNKKRFGLAILLFTLMLCKVSAFHVFTHQNESSNTIESCSICDIAVENQLSELSFPASNNSLPVASFVFVSPNSANHIVLFSEKLSLGKCYCRPPPFLV